MRVGKIRQVRIWAWIQVMRRISVSSKEGTRVFLSPFLAHFLWRGHWSFLMWPLYIFLMWLLKSI